MFTPTCSTYRGLHLLPPTTPHSTCNELHLWKSTLGPYLYNFAQVKSMDDNCGEWVECMGLASGCGEQEVGVASGSGWNLWVWLLGVVLRRYVYRFPHTTYPYSSCICSFCSSIPTFVHLKKNFFRSCSSTLKKLHFRY